MTLKKFKKRLRDFYQHPGWVISVLCALTCIILLTLYFTLDRPYLLPHFAAVFLELSLAILFVEGIIKPSLESSEEKRIKKEKKRSFLRNILRHDIDVMLKDYLAEFENITDMFDISSTLTETEMHTVRLSFLEANKSYFHYFDRLEPFQGSVFTHTESSPEHTYPEALESFFASWETLLEEAIENVRLINSKPQYTPHHTWDNLIDLFVELKRHNHDIHYLRQNTSAEQNILKLYFAGIKVFSALTLDLNHFECEKDSAVCDPLTYDWAESVWEMWHSAPHDRLAR